MDNAFPYDEPSRWSHQFLAGFPAKYRIDITRMIVESVKIAYNDCLDFLPGIRRDLFPHIRRAHVETGLVNLAQQKYSTRGLVGREVLNKTANHRHAEITTQDVVLIAAAVDSEDESPRWAAYRDSLAVNPQGAFPLPDNPITIPGSALLAIMLYGPRSAYPAAPDQMEPGFVVVKFPATDWSCWVEGRVDLWARLQEHDRRRDQGLEPLEEDEAN